MDHLEEKSIDGSAMKPIILELVSHLHPEYFER
jgi:hypothetical protein